MIRTAAFVAILFAGIWGATGVSEGQATPAVVGQYACEGTNPDGTPYKGIVEIAANDDTFLVRWTLSNNVEVLGVGLLQDDVFSVSYFGGAPAVAVYKVDGERLVGHWTMGAEGRINSETLTKQANAQPGSLRKPSSPSSPQRPRRGIRL